MIPLRYNTTVNVMVGPLILNSDGVSEATGLTLSQGDIELFKEGGANFSAKSNASDATPKGNGYYLVTLNGSDTGTEGFMVLRIQNTDESTILPYVEKFIVVSQATYDAMYNDSTNYYPVDVKAQTIDVDANVVSSDVTLTGAASHG